MLVKRVLETAAMTIIGDSVLCMISPRRHLTLWLSGPPWWRRLWTPFVRRPEMTRTLGAAGLAFGLWLAWRQEPQMPTGSARRQPESRVRRSLRILEEAAQ